MLDEDSLDTIFHEQPPLPNLWPGGCFGCAPSNPYGLHMRFWDVEGECVSRFQIPVKFCGFDGIAHGGIVACILDEACSWVLAVQLDRFGMTKRAEIKYHRPVPVDMDLVVKARISNHTETRASTNAEIIGPNGDVLAEMSSVWDLPPLATIARVTGVDEGVLRDMMEQLLAPIRELRTDKV